jgi:hypothetical protein
MIFSKLQERREAAKDIGFKIPANHRGIGLLDSSMVSRLTEDGLAE